MARLSESGISKTKGKALMCANTLWFLETFKSHHIAELLLNYNVSLLYKCPVSA